MNSREMKKNDSQEEEPLVIRIARAVFGCSNPENRLRFASTSLEDSYVWSKELSMASAGVERYDIVEKRQETFCENTGDSVFSDRRRLDRHRYRSDDEIRQQDTN